MGLADLLYTTPLSKMGPLPSEVMFPPLWAEVKVMLVTGSVLTIGSVTIGRALSSFLHEAIVAATMISNG